MTGWRAATKLAQARVDGRSKPCRQSLPGLAAALKWAKGNDRTTAISIVTDAHAWVRGDADRDLGVPEVSKRDSVRKARDHQDQIRARQRIGV